jgi:hypothetical protein
MRQWLVAAVVAIPLVGCGDNDDDVGKVKTPIPMDQVPEVVLKAAKEVAPDLTFFAAYKDTFEGHDSIELKGKNKLGKIREIEVSPEGKVLGSE